MPLQKAPNAIPKNKVVASTAAAAIASIALQILTANGFEVSPDLQTTVVTLLTFALGYLIPDRA
jgi:hypothetical protein